MKHLIAGFGSIGRRHFRNLKSLGENDIVLLRSGKSTLPLEEIDGVPTEFDLTAALKHKPDTVFITNPTSEHLPIALAAAEAGCHLFIEKPVSHTAEGLDQLVERVKRNNCRVLVGYQFRFHPGIRKIKELLTTPEIGKPLSARVEWGEYLPGWHPWEDYRKSYSALKALGGGVSLTLSHPIDYLHWLFGELAWVFGAVSQISQLEVDSDDLTEAILQFESGPTTSLHLDYYQRPGVHRLSIVTETGRIDWDNRDGIVHLYNADEKRWDSFEPAHNFDRNDMFVEQTRHFLAVCEGKEQPVCTLEDGIHALKVALTLQESSELGCRLAVN